MADRLFVSSRFSGNATLRDVLNNRATLQSGSSGEAVRIAQRALIDLGESMPAGADGSFGNQTRNAVVHYQNTRGLSADGIIGANTMSRLDSDIVAFDTSVTPPPAVLRTLHFWINAFIPDPSVTPHVFPAPGASTGQSMILVPWPNLTGHRCFLGDSRTYSPNPLVTARIHGQIDIFNLDNPSPTASPPPHFHCGESVEIDPTSGVVIGRDTAPADRCHFTALRANTTPDPIAGVIVDNPSPNFVQLDFVAAANLPLLVGSPDIDMFGRIQINRDLKTFRVNGAVDGFPSFEAYVQFNGGPVVNLFKVDPVEPFQLIGGANRVVDVTVPFGF